MRFTAVYFDPRLGDSQEADINAENVEQAIQKARAKWPDLEMLLNGDREVAWERNPLIFFKWMCDGARSLEEISRIMREQADSLDRKSGEGWRLSHPVSDGVAMLERPDSL